MSEWQPIETAPKDGTPILGTRFNTFLNIWEAGVIRWLSGTWNVVPTKDMRLSHMASHWMPIPEPPTSVCQKEGE